MNTADNQQDEWPEDRIDAIGRNGNLGLHYETAVPQPTGQAEEVDWLTGVPACSVDNPDCEACQ